MYFYLKAKSLLSHDSTAVRSLQGGIAQHDPKGAKRECFSVLWGRGGLP